jgi:hypothetical protein
MRRHSPGLALAGIVLLVAALAAALLARGVADAASGYRETQARWQSGLAPYPPERPGSVQAAAEHLLGVRAQSELMRAYLDYRVRLADVIEGTQYPQTQARWNAISAIDRLRPSLASRRDRAAADVVLGVVYAASATASGPGQQRQTLVRYAVDALTRAVLTDPANADAKHNLEVILAAAAAAEAESRRRNAGREPQKGKPTPTPHAQPAGTGY